MTDPGGEFFRDRSILVTGGTGSIGRAIVEALVSAAPRALRVLSRDDTKQFELQQRFRDETSLRMLIGDVRSADRMRRAMAGIDMVFHAAALKHVPACEFNPFEAAETNVRGTQNVAEAAIDSGVERVLTISTDKAVDPTNVMGATKLLSERLMSAAQLARGPASIRFGSVRFGNVIDSRGSLIPLVRSQLAHGGPVTITDPDMTRYLMPVSDAVMLCLRAMERMEGGEVFILKMPRVRVGDLVEVLVEACAPAFGYAPSEIHIDYIGSRPGEKRDEVLMTAYEAERAIELSDMYVVNAVGSANGGIAVAGGRGQEPLLDHAQIREVLGAAGCLKIS